MKKKNKTSRIKEILLNYIYNNLREFIIVTIVFLIGLILGIIFINNAEEAKAVEISNYIMDFIKSIKENYSIDKLTLLKESIISNLSIVMILWFAGCTIVGLPILYCLVGIRGFCLGYTISAIIASVGLKNGIIFTLSSLLLQNIIFIPVLFSIAVSGIKLYKSIIKDKRKENIKVELCRHTMFCGIIGSLFVIASLIEVYVSTSLFLNVVKYI